MIAIDLTGKVFGNVTVLGEDLNRKKGDKNRRWFVQCSCGNIFSTVGQNLKKRKKEQNCNRCVSKPGKAMRNVAECPIRRHHDLIMWRCYDKSHCEYQYFGGRGIKVWQKWKCFKRFYSDLCHFPFGLDFDRIDVEGTYSPSNCMITNWTTVRYDLWEFEDDEQRELLLDRIFSLGGAY